jgi:hypothetical protein
MDEWICEKDYTFKLYPTIGTLETQSVSDLGVKEPSSFSGTWGCYNDTGDYNQPIHNNIINILLILAIIILAYIIYRKRCNHEKNKQNKKM